jgi:hypothetical protein
MIDVSRREFMKAAGVATTHLCCTGAVFSQTLQDDPAGMHDALTEPALRTRISKSDLLYTHPVLRGEEGIPVGNGRMGTLVWTTPSQLRMQINRVDVYANNSTTSSFVEAANDYCGGCAFLDIDFGSEVFPESGVRQHLQVFDGRLLIEAAGVTLEVFPVFSHDVIAISVADHRTARMPITATLRALRYETKYLGAQLEIDASEHASTVQTRNQTAKSRLIGEDHRASLTQEFREGAYLCKSAVTVEFVGAPAVAEIANETSVRLRANDSEPSLILIGSAASFDGQEDITDSARAQVEAVAGIDSVSLKAESEQWWHSFWQRGSLELRSKDGTAEFIQENYHYFLYLMASTSQGKFPAKFNGMLWNTGGDLRTWGAQHWYTNISCYYEALPASGRVELMDPMFDMYSGMFEACATAARQQWGSQGIYIPETAYFDGLERLPDSIASEMQALYLERKPWSERSNAFLEYAATRHPYSSRWNWMNVGHWKDGRYIVPERGDGPYGPTSHWFTSTAKVAYLYWRRYEYTQDHEWLRQRAYPMLRGAVEFYRCHPNVSKGADGKYHIRGANNGEAVRGAHDATEDLSAMRAATAALVRAAEILQIDAQMVPVWREFLENVAPLPTSGDPEALGVENYHGPRVLVSGLKPAMRPGSPRMLQDINSLPTWFFDLCSVETRDREMVVLAENTLRQFILENPEEATKLRGLSKLAVAAASLGWTDAVQKMVPNQMKALPVEKSSAYKKAAALANRMSLLEGPQGLGAEHLGRAAEALHMALLQSNPPAPAEEPILHLFPAWPKDWDASYTLFARGAFTVTASMQTGEVRLLEIYSHAGSRCRLRNPFSNTVHLYRDGKRAELMNGAMLEFGTEKGERIEVKPQAL